MIEFIFKKKNNIIITKNDKLYKYSIRIIMSDYFQLLPNVKQINNINF